eukprot:jgi/Mesen1/1234/ME000129S00335
MAAEINKEAFVELQGRLLETDRKLKQFLQSVDDWSVRRDVGGSFVLEPLEVLQKEQEEKVKDCESNKATLQASKEYLERQMREVENNFKELVQQTPALAQQILAPAQ